MATSYRPRPQPATRHTVRRPMANFRRNPASPLRHVDIVLVLCVAVVTMFGALMVYSTTRGATAPYDTSYVKRVIMFMMIGGVVMGGRFGSRMRRVNRAKKTGCQPHNRVSPAPDKNMRKRLIFIAGNAPSAARN